MIHRCPHACPVCRGVGFLSAGFYSARSGGDVATWALGNTQPSEVCRTCGGTGVIWHDVAYRADAVAQAVKERDEYVARIAQKHQPAGSPPPGDVPVLLAWILDRQAEEIARLRDKTILPDEYEAEMHALKERIREQAEEIARLHRVLEVEQEGHAEDKANAVQAAVGVAVVAELERCAQLAEHFYDGQESSWADAMRPASAEIAAALRAGWSYRKTGGAE